MKRFYIVIGLLLLAGLLFWGGSALASSKTPLQQQIESLQDQAADTTDPAAGVLLQQKIEPLSAEQAARATAQANAPDKNSDFCALRPTIDPNAPPAPTVAVPRGISDWLQPPFSTQDVVVTNQWNDEVGGVLLTAYAGALGLDPQQGVVISVDAQGNYVRYALGENSGAASFTAADGALVSVTTSNGLSFTLDMSALMLTTSDGQAVTGEQQEAPQAIDGWSPCQ
jgi:hypothetical protein